MNSSRGCGPLRQLAVDWVAHVVVEISLVIEDPRHQVLVTIGAFGEHEADEA